jgi:hypothetical protein
MRVVSRLAALGGVTLALPTLFACLEHPIKPVELDNVGIKDNQIQLTVNKNVDILFVMDNSGSMGEEQANLAANFGDFIGELEKEGVEANYRIGITTTDNGNPICGATTTPEAGNLVLSSCLGREQHFTFTGTNPATVVFDTACESICDYSPAELDDLMKETATDLDPNPRKRPWMESVEGATNLPDGVTTEEAFQCFGPQGIDGCGFESHLESMYKSLKRSKDSSENAYGFLRENAILAIVVVTDEVDCSYQTKWGEIFESSGNRVFWQDPEAQWASSAVCWNAGVECSGPSDDYDACRPVDKDVNGNVTGDSSAAVLHPITRYSELIQGFEDEKKKLDPNQEVIIGVISGVPEGYYLGQQDIRYADSPDPGFMDDFGIGPGCTSVVDGVDQAAVPPVRMRDWAEDFGDENLYSVCSKDYTPALKRIAFEIADQIRPACYKNCAADIDPATEGLQVECFVEETVPSQPTELIPECRKVGGQWELPSAADNVCYFTRTDQTQSGDAIDDMADDCVEDGFNLEFELLRREGFPAAGGSSVTATCELADFPTVDCPNLGG